MKAKHSLLILFVGLLGGMFSVSAAAQAVLQSVTVRVAPGQMDAYLGSVEKLQGVLDRVGGGATVAVWQATLAGPASGTTMVGVSYPSLESYAAVTRKAQADGEWQRIVGGLDGVRTLVSTSLLSSADGGGPVTQPASGSVLQGVIVRPHAGKNAAYLEQIDKLQAVQERVGSSGQLRAWNVAIGGEGAGTIAVGIVYPSLAAYAADQGKLQADPEGAKLFAGLDDLRTVESVSLFTAE